MRLTARRAPRLLNFAKSFTVQMALNVSLTVTAVIFSHTLVMVKKTSEYLLIPTLFPWAMAGLIPPHSSRRMSTDL